MKKVGYFFYTFVPLLAVEAIQTIALFFMMGMGVFGQGFVGKLAFPSANVSDRLEKTFTSVNFSMMIMVIYALIAIFGMWYYARYEGNFLPSPKKTFNPMMIVAIVILVPGTQFAANFIANLTGYIRPDWLQQYTKLFELDGVGLEFTDDAVNAIADKALERKTGARGLRAIMEAVMLDLMYRIPSDKSISKCVIDKDIVEANLKLDGECVPEAYIEEKAAS